jgi:hypothetical protein
MKGIRLDFRERIALIINGMKWDEAFPEMTIQERAIVEEIISPIYAIQASEKLEKDIEEQGMEKILGLSAGMLCKITQEALVERKKEIQAPQN